MSPFDWGLLQGLKNWDGVPGAGTTYSTHIYSPWTYTHQGILGNPLDTEGWPGERQDYRDSQILYYDIEWVRQQVRIITEFMQRTQSKVIITEFGALRWAKDSDKYLNDLITVFEENKVEWIFHSMAGIQHLPLTGKSP